MDEKPLKSNPDDCPTKPKQKKAQVDNKPEKDVKGEMKRKIAITRRKFRLRHTAAITSSKNEAFSTSFQPRNTSSLISKACSHERIPNLN